MAQIRMAGQNRLKDGYRHVKERIGEAAARAGRSSQDVALVAVTKTATPDQIRTLVEAGHEDFGESRVQQLSQRVAGLDEFLGRKRFLNRESEEVGEQAVRWHMIGHLQRNKVKQVVPLVQMIHSVDSLRLAEELHALGARSSSRSGELGQPIEILLQVNASGEEQKFGLAVPAVTHFAEQIDTMLNLRLRGLMTMAPQTDDKEMVRACFTRTTELFEEIRKESYVTDQFNVLSMGMSNDYEIAIEEGANLVRVGRAIFGEGEA